MWQLHIKKAKGSQKILYAHGFSNFPELNNATNSRASKNHPRGVVVKQIKEDNKLTNKAHNNSHDLSMIRIHPT